MAATPVEMYENRVLLTATNDVPTDLADDAQANYIDPYQSEIDQAIASSAVDTSTYIGAPDLDAATTESPVSDYFDPFADAFISGSEQAASAQNEATSDATEQTDSASESQTDPNEIDQNNAATDETFSVFSGDADVAGYASGMLGDSAAGMMGMGPDGSSHNNSPSGESDTTSGDESNDTSIDDGDETTQYSFDVADETDDEFKVQLSTTANGSGTVGGFINYGSKSPNVVGNGYQSAQSSGYSMESKTSSGTELAVHLGTEKTAFLIGTSGSYSYTEDSNSFRREAWDVGSNGLPYSTSDTVTTKLEEEHDHKFRLSVGMEESESSSDSAASDSNVNEGGATFDYTRTHTHVLDITTGTGTYVELTTIEGAIGDKAPADQPPADGDNTSNNDDSGDQEEADTGASGLVKNKTLTGSGMFGDHVTVLTSNEQLPWLITVTQSGDENDDDTESSDEESEELENAIQAILDSIGFSNNYEAMVENMLAYDNPGGGGGCDCDDVADFMQRILLREINNIRVSIVVAKWLYPESPSNLVSGRAMGHAMLMVERGGRYWLANATRNDIEGPFLNVEDFWCNLYRYTGEEYGADPGEEIGLSGPFEAHVELGDGAPWYESQEMSQRVADWFRKMKLDPETAFPDGVEAPSPLPPPFSWWSILSHVSESFRYVPPF